MVEYLLRTPWYSVARGGLETPGRSRNSMKKALTPLEPGVPDLPADDAVARRDVMRARQRYLSLLPADSPLPDPEIGPPAQVTFAGRTQRYLRRQLAVPGRLRGGLLFGERHGEILHIVLASPLGYPWWYTDPRQAFLHPDERYLLGWSDCVEEVYGGRVDWVGNWLAYPNNTLGDIREDIRWIDLGAQHGLVDDRHLLLVVGWVEGALTVRAYGYDLGEWVSVSCVLGGVMPSGVPDEPS